MQLPKEVLRHGGKLALHFRTIAMDESNSDKRDVLEKFDRLKKEPYNEIPAGVFSGDELDRIQLFSFPMDGDVTGLKKTFQTSMPSAVLRELQLTSTPLSVNHHQITVFQNQYCFQKHLELVSRCVLPHAVSCAQGASEYLVSAHEPSIFPEKIFSLAACRLQLEMLISFRQINPTFFQNGVRVLFRSILDCPPQALRTILPSTAEAAMMQSMVEFCTQVIGDTDSTPVEKCSALSLLFALAESGGRAHHLLSVVEALLLDQIGGEFPGVKFEHDVFLLLSRFEAYRIQFDLGPTLANPIKRIRIQEEDGSVRASIASNGRYLFTFTNNGLSKIGSGFHGTMVGNVYANQPLASFSEWLGWDMANAQEKPFTAHVTCMQERVFLWFVWKDADATNGSILFELAESDLNMVSRDCADLETSEVVKSASHVAFCSDGTYMFIVSTTDTTFSWRQLDPTDNWVCVRQETYEIASLPPDSQALVKASIFPLFYTNGHVLIGSLKHEANMKQLKVVAIQSKHPVVQYSESVCDNEPSAICFDVLNNALWSVSSKMITCNANSGLRIQSRRQRVVDSSLQTLFQDPMSSLNIGLRIMAQVESLADSYLPDDIDQMDVDVYVDSIPFCVDVHASTFKILVALVNHFAALPPTHSCKEFVIVVCLKLLSLNTLHWLVSKDAHIADVIGRGDFPTILRSLFTSTNGPRIAHASRMLYVLSLDIIHPTVSSQWKLLVKYLSQSAANTLSEDEAPIVNLLLDRFSSRRKIQDMVREAGNGEFEGMQWLRELIDMSFATTKEHLENDSITSSSISTKLTHMIHTVVQAFFGGCYAKVIPIKSLFEIVPIIVQVFDRLCRLDGEHKLKILEESILGELAAPLFGYLQTLLACHDKAKTELSCATLMETSHIAMQFLKSLTLLIQSVPKEEREVLVEAQIISKSTVTMESAHEYANDMHEVTELRLDGATSMTITFDRRTRTERNYDYITFYRDKSCTTFYGEEKYSGRDSSFNWPGVEGIPPLVIDSDHCFVLFHTDGSTTDWGYKFTALANVSENNVTLSVHWAISIEEQVLNWLSTMTTLHTKWAPLEGLELDQIRYLDSDLLHGGMDTEGDNEVTLFLRELIALEGTDTPAAHVAQILKKHTIQDQGSIDHINRAVRSVAAAILHHNMWGMDAYALGQGFRNDPSASLLKAWKNAQKMRNWFDVGDAKRTTEKSEQAPPPKMKLSRQPSAYAGASDDALRTLCKNVESRAKFLLSLAPATFSLATASEDPTGTRRHLSMLAKYGTALKHGENPDSILDKWHSLVGEVGAATELKRMMLYRKHSAGRHQGNHEKTMTEMVLEFVQSDVVVPDIDFAISARNTRAEYRRLGLSILCDTIKLCRNTRLLHNLLESFSKSISELESHKVHHLTHTNGCSLVLRNSMREVFCNCLHAFKSILRSPESDTNVICSILKFVALDYDVKDGDLVYRSEIIPAVFNALTSPELNVRSTAQATARVMLERFMVKDKETNIQKQLCICLQHYLDRVHELNTCGFYLPSQSSVRNEYSPISNFGFWMFVPRINWRQLRKGDRVAPGPHSKETQFSLGHVKGVHGTEISVIWNSTVNEKSKEGFQTYDPAKHILEIIPVDQDPSGQLVLLTNHTDSPWGNISLRLTTDLRIDASVALGASEVATITSEGPLSTDTWYYIQFGHDNEVLCLTVTGDTTYQKPLPDSLKFVEVSHATKVIESSHPFQGREGEWSFFPVSIPHAASVQVSIDGESSLGADSNYISFFLDDTMKIRFGEPKNTQDCNQFPGVDKNEPLDIPSGHFVVGLFTAIATESWGFRMHVRAVESAVSLPPTQKSLYQIYFGELPSRIGDVKAAMCWIDDFKLLDTIERDFQRDIPPRVAPVYSLSMALNALSLVGKCISSENEYGAQILSSSVPLHHALHMSFSTSVPVIVRCAAINMISHVLSNTQIDFHDSDVYIMKSLDFLASAINPWVEKKVIPHQLSAASSMWMTSCYSSFLRASCNQIDLGAKIASIIAQQIQQPFEHGKMLAALAVLGGVYDGVFVGSRVKCLVKKDSIESGSVVDYFVIGSERFASVLMDLDTTHVERVSLERISLENQVPMYLSCLYDRMSPYLSILVDAMVQFETKLTLPLIDIQSRLLKAIHQLSKYHPNPVVVSLLRPSLMKLSLMQYDGSLLGVKPSFHDYESRHPYADSLDVYEVVNIKNAKSLKITFNPASRTEHECDYLVFYKDESQTERWGEDRYSGRDGSENFPGIGGRSSLEIPSDHFVLYWHTDSSNNDWGYKFTIEATYNDVPPSSFNLKELNQRMYHLTEIMYEKGQTIESLPNIPQLDVKSKSLWTQNGSSTTNLLYFGTECSNEWIVCLPELVLYNVADTTSEKICTLQQGNIVQIIEHVGEWICLKHGEIQGWFKLETASSLQRVKESFENATQMIPTWDSANMALPENEELITIKRDGVENFESHFKVATVKFVTPSSTTATLIQDFAQCMSIQYAKKCLHTYLSTGISEDSLTVEEFLQIAQIFVLENGTAYNVLGKLLEALIYQPHFCDDIISKCVSAIAQVIKKLPSNRLVVQTVDDMERDSIVQINFPGVSSIRISFDKHTHCHASGEFVQVYDRERAVGSKYQGPKGGNWPGAGKVEPLVVNSDTVTIHFEYLNDTDPTCMIKFVAQGIFPENSENSSVPSSEDVYSVRLACWVLRTTASTNSFPGHLIPSLLDMLCQLYQFMPEVIQLDVIDVWTSLLENSNIFDELLPKQIHIWMTFMKNKLRLKHASEIRTKSVHLRRLLQVVVECDIKFDQYCLRIESLSNTFTPFLWNNYGIENAIELAHNGAIAVMKGNEPCRIRTREGMTTGRHAWNIQMSHVTSNIDIGLATESLNTMYMLPSNIIFQESDILGFELDFHLKELIFKRNGSVIHTVKIGEHPMLFPAAVLKGEGSEIRIKKHQPLKSVHFFNCQNPSWYSKIMSSLSLLQGFNEIEMRKNAHVTNMDTDVVIPKAKCLHVIVEPGTCLAPNLALEIKNNTQTHRLECLNNVIGRLQHTKANSVQDDIILKYVARSYDWQYESDDGSAGNLGVVLSLESWSGVANTAVRVHWLHTKIVGIYRYGFHGMYDVEVLPKFESIQRGILFDGDSLHLSRKLSSDSISTFNGSLHFEGSQHVIISSVPSLHRDFTIELWLRMENTDPSCIFHVINAEKTWWMALSLTRNQHLNFSIFREREEHISVFYDAKMKEWSRIDVCACGSLIAIHIDGKLAAHQVVPLKLQLERTQSCDLTLGIHPDCSGTQPLCGHIFGVKLWNAPLHLREYSKLLVNDDMHLVEECPTFDQLVQESYTQEAKFSRDIPKSIVALAHLYEDMTFKNNSSHFSSIRPKYINVHASTQHTKVYYEITLIHASCVQVGWSFKNCAPKDQSSGIGDCKLSFGVNLAAQAKWHGEKEHLSEVPWKPGDVIGCLLDWNLGEMTFSVNGRVLDDVKFTRGSDGAFQHEVNSPTPSLLMGLWGDDDDDVDENDDEEIHEANSENVCATQGPSFDDNNNQTDRATTRPHDDVSIPNQIAPEDGRKCEVHLPELTTPIKDNPWMQHGGIFPSLSFRAGDSIRWNFGHIPFHHQPEGFVPIIDCGNALNKPIKFEKYDFNDKQWQNISFRHRVNKLKVTLLGDWPCQEGQGDTVFDNTFHKRNGKIQQLEHRTWDESIAPPLDSLTAGISLIVRPIFSNARSLVLNDFHFEAASIPGKHKEYLEMVRYINKVAVSRGMNLNDIFQSSWKDISPEKEELVRWPLMADLIENKEDMEMRFAKLVQFNQCIKDTLNFVELTSKTSLANEVSKARGFIFGLVKTQLWDSAIEKTKAATSPDMALTLNRPKASRWKQTNSDFNRFALFAQAYREMIHWIPTTYLRSTNLYVVTFLGENSIDAGGPYRETLSQYCTELQSAQLPLLLPTPNAQHNVGAHRDAWVLHPISHQQHSGMLVFLGKLLGVAIRTKFCLSLKLSQVVWKLLVQDTITVDDLDAIDTLIVSSMRSLRNIEHSGVTEETFADVMLETMTTLSTDNRMVHLVDGGDAIPVTFATRHMFADLVESYRMHEFDEATSYLRQGLGMVVPLRLLRLFTWMELESLVCGTPEVDIDLLKTCTEYSGCQSTDQHIVWFWEVLRGYSQESREAFLRFVWGRSRLPRSVHEFQCGQQFKLQVFERSPADVYLPVSHTCFFSLELPRYTSLEVLSTRLTYAIYNCVAIDGDSNTMQANQLGWED
ncbi:Aste57867_9018 [Aphanomyces stellatus]|uniref:Aste57867_9018 protein n=1 Tax=Aphanomyces stellatus TaxID=120398 RepID=A0A485KLZ6_9STRA|nr:hypothetical protein As57867_008982 [Aphanomyces stellatus]VFT85902.1 Aste57867_9018 [Aphanomyces stellatus]